ncbi:MULTISPECIES: tyrosine-protein phosphatase [unclassified Rhizobium]|jgi:protein-tyrosine phosphatase|uniref:tyrosine-protein phosphatase n=1 Tax=unclassified Rhizobium TaxID=2613769 RepID=UPI00064654F7|nr:MULTISPECIES: tyrosine-protein phosphatase [unclassified Rhizobium]MBN8952476.1 tyrosine-protein phosphatase [Rhizobium tropici]OJY78954.1 MAG: protein tyrosine phosphatase [Rhizobium sp. 60-20]RKD67677.1 protein-tyrosine phosphatase [Rhizobium sp. WW_1]
MNSNAMRHLPVKGTYNVRDLGGYSAGEATTLWRRVLRADGLHRLDDEGMAVLTGEGVRVVIDLRNGTELTHQPNPFSRNEAVRYHNISLFDTLAPTYRPDADTLLDLYVRALRERREAICAVLSLIADADDGVVLFHCTAGKDRTGIIAALLLLTAGVDTTTILEDYSLTGSLIAPMVDDILANAVAQGADIEKFRPLLACDPATMAATIAFIEQEYRTVADYLGWAGLPAETVSRLRQRLLGNS